MERIATDDQTRVIFNSSQVLLMFSFCFCSLLTFFLFKWIPSLLMLTLALEHYWSALCRSLSGRLNHLTPAWSLQDHQFRTFRQACITVPYLILRCNCSCESWARWRKCTKHLDLHLKLNQSRKTSKCLFNFCKRYVYLEKKTFFFLKAEMQSE